MLESFGNPTKILRRNSLYGNTKRYFCKKLGESDIRFVQMETSNSLGIFREALNAKHISRSEKNIVLEVVEPHEYDLVKFANSMNKKSKKSCDLWRFRQKIHEIVKVYCQKWRLEMYWRKLASVLYMRVLATFLPSLVSFGRIVLAERSTKLDDKGHKFALAVTAYRRPNLTSQETKNKVGVWLLERHYATTLKLPAKYGVRILR